MTDDRRTPAQIEAEIDLERARLVQNIDELQDRLTVDSLMGEVRAQVKIQVDDVSVQLRDQMRSVAGDMGDQLRGQFGVIGHHLRESARQNPWPVAVAGLGLGWFAWRSLTAQNKPTVPPVDVSPAYAPISKPTPPADYDMSPADMAAHSLEDNADSWADTMADSGSQPIPSYDPEPSWARDNDALTLSRPKT